MKTQKNIFIAFLLNLLFSVFELIGGALTGSIAILSDAVHDIGDAASIGISYFLERKSKQKPDERYTYGYLRYSVMGSLITTVILLVGSLTVIYHAVLRILNPVPIHYDGMIVLAVIGTIVNLLAAWFTKEGDSLNQKAVNLHMLEDVLGWLAVLVGAILMRFTDICVIDPILSVLVAVFIFVNAVKQLREVETVFLERLPEGVDSNAIKEDVLRVEGVSAVHHFHIRSIDGFHHDATMHLVTEAPPQEVKHAVREVLGKYSIVHATLELESPHEHCDDEHCHLDVTHHNHGHHHHHH